LLRAAAPDRRQTPGVLLLRTPPRVSLPLLHILSAKQPSPPPPLLAAGAQRRRRKPRHAARKHRYELWQQLEREWQALRQHARRRPARRAWRGLQQVDAWAEQLRLAWQRLQHADSLHVHARLLRAEAARVIRLHQRPGQQPPPLWEQHCELLLVWACQTQQVAMWLDHAAAEHSAAARQLAQGGDAAAAVAPAHLWNTLQDAAACVTKAASAKAWKTDGPYQQQQADLWGALDQLEAATDAPQRPVHGPEETLLPRHDATQHAVVRAALEGAFGVAYHHVQVGWLGRAWG